MGLEWFGDSVKASIATAVAAGLEAAGQGMVVELRGEIDTPYPPASEPGNPPHRRSGTLKAEQAAWVETVGGDVVLRLGVPGGSPAYYASFVGEGTRRMEARPWIPGVVARLGNDVVETVAHYVGRAL